MAIRFRYTDKIPPWLRNKFVITLIIFVLWVLLFDANNLVDRWKGLKKLRSLQADREYYSKRIDEDHRKLEELRTDDASLEKFAREQYRMKKPDEDIFIVVTPEEGRRIQQESAIR